MENKLYKKKLTIVTVLYLLFVIWAIILKLNIDEFFVKYRGIYLIPFSDNNTYVSSFNEQLCTTGNILIFVPLGIYFSLFFKESKFYKRIGLSVLVVFLSTLFLEIVQYVFAIGIFSTTDLIHNSLGGLIGIIIYELLKKLVSNKAINFINKYSMVILMLIDVFALVNTLINIKLYI